MSKQSNFSILVDVELNTRSIQEQLRRNNIKFNIDGNAITIAGKSLNELGESAKQAGDQSKKFNEDIKDVSLSVDAANKVFTKSVEIIRSMVGQVFDLDSALTEFSKVSNLSGDSLDNYVSKLSEMGNSVARTGKPNWSEPVCCDGKTA